MLKKKGGTVSPVEIHAVKAFLAEKKSDASVQNGRLVIENNQIQFKDKSTISRWVLFQAKLGFGNASMRLITNKIDRQRETFFSSSQLSTDSVSKVREDFNSFIISYNKKRSICWKKARQIKNLSNTIITGIDLAVPLTNDQIFKLIEGNFNKCKQVFSSFNSDNPKELIEAFVTLSLAFAEWEPTLRTSDKKQYRLEKKLLNSILNLKNEVRAACIVAGVKPLKGNNTSQDKLLKISDQQELRETLKAVRTQILKKHFKERLEKDALKLAELQFRFIENKEKNLFNGQEAFIEKQLERWQHKIDQGKPIAIPKWYHCTKDLPTLQKILDTYILYMHKGAYPGCFVANIPEHGYGGYCIAMSEHIEETGTKNPKSKIPVYPNFSQLHENQAYPIKYSDTWVAPQDGAYKNNQQGVGIWFGFQRGARTINKSTGFGTDGIPLKSLDLLNTDKPLHSYKDTTVAFIFNQYNDGHIQSVAMDRRIQYLSYEQVEALRSLINATFMCTLPKSWENKLKQCRGRWY